MLRTDLSLSYTEIGFLLSIPSFVSLAVEPVLGIVAVRWNRRALVLGGGLIVGLALVVAACAPSFWVLLVAFALLYPATGAFVSLSQAALMDLEPQRREQNMARWTFAGAVGVLLGPLLLGASEWVGLGWRPVFAACAAVTFLLVVAVRRAPDPAAQAVPLRVGEAVRAMARRDVFRWLFLLELSDLLLDVLLAFVALYFVDEVGVSPSAGGLAVAVFTGGGLVGSAVAVRLAAHVDGLRYLRWTAALCGGLFLGFLLAPGVEVKLVVLAALAIANAGWYPLLKARLYGTLEGASGLVMTVGALFPLNAVLPIAIAAAAERWGLQSALWALLAAPIALLVLVPRAPRSDEPDGAGSP